MEAQKGSKSRTLKHISELVFFARRDLHHEALAQYILSGRGALIAHFEGWSRPTVRFCHRETALQFNALLPNPDKDLAGMIDRYNPTQEFVVLIIHVDSLSTLSGVISVEGLRDE